ncbi:MAG: hypothetical protein WCR45_10340 [Bacteroidaceae bacterium]
MDYKDMTFLEAAKIEQRMCKTGCGKCGLSSINNKYSLNCQSLRMEYPEEYLRILADYDKAHPVKTILQEFLEKYPNAPLNKCGMPRCCPGHLYSYISTGCPNEGGANRCVACWNQPAEVQK